MLYSRLPFDKAQIGISGGESGKRKAKPVSSCGFRYEMPVQRERHPPERRWRGRLFFRSWFRVFTNVSRWF